MKTTLDLPDELVREVKLRAVVQGRTLKDLVTEFLRRGLGMTPREGLENPPASPMVEIGNRGLPTIRCAPNAPAARMTVRDLLEIERETLTEEDSQLARKPL